MKHSYRITKYEPSSRNDKDKIASEWTSYSDIKDIVAYKDYLSTETAYINAVLEISRSLSINSFQLSGLEQNTNSVSFKEGQTMNIMGIDAFIRMILREEIWCKLVSEKGEFHFGYDFYMYFVSNENPEHCFQDLSNILYCESFKSPYLATVKE